MFHTIHVHQEPLKRFKVILILVQSDIYLICEVRNAESTFTGNKEIYIVWKKQVHILILDLFG